MTDDRVMIFIDGQNVFYGVKSYNKGESTSIKIDYSKLVKKLAEGKQLKRAYFYGSIPQNPKDDRQTKFHQRLQYDGIKTKIIPLKVRQYSFKCPSCNTVTKTTKEIEKGVDIALASDMLSLGLSNKYDTAILVSGDYDYHMAIEVLQRNGVVADLAFFRNYKISEELIRTVDHFIDLEEMIKNKLITS